LVVVLVMVLVVGLSSGYRHEKRVKARDGAEPVQLGKVKPVDGFHVVGWEGGGGCRRVSDGAEGDWSGDYNGLRRRRRRALIVVVIVVYMYSQLEGVTDCSRSKVAAMWSKGSPKIIASVMVMRWRANGLFFRV
jgi:hypothetical protein